MKTATNKKGTADYIDKYVGDRIKKLRLANDMSQEVLGELIGVTFQQVQKYEKGINRVSSSKLYSVTKIFKCRFEDLFPPQEGDTQYLSLDERTVTILKICKEIELEDCKKLKAAVKIIKG